MLRTKIFAGAMAILTFLAVSGTANAGLISRAIIDFNDSFGRFAFDNLTTDLTTLTFDEVANQSVDGLTVNGITFTFTVGGAPSADAFYNAGGPGTLTYVDVPVLEGDATGILQLDFAVPTSLLYFGLALSDFQSGIGATVQLFDENLIAFGGLQNVQVDPLISFTEGQFRSDVPEPATLGLLGLGLVGVGATRRRRRRA